MPHTTRPAVMLACALLAALAAGAVAAQDATEAIELEPVTVTGTRLRLARPDGAYPLTVVDRDALEQSGQAFVGEFLQRLPFMGGSPLSTSTGRRGEGGQLSRGIATVELRGLGETRTLVLVDGRRFVPGGAGASGVVDLNMIPLAQVARIEILKTGASVEYGADAVAGVVNIVTVQERDGVRLTAHGRVTDEGDGEQGRASVLLGHSGSLGHVNVGLEFVDQASVSKGARAFSEQRQTLDGPDNRIVFDGSSAPPRGNFATSAGRLTLIEGEDGDRVSDFRPFINGGAETDRFNFNPFEDLRQPAERLSAFAHGRLEPSPAFGLFGQAFYHQRDSRTQLAPLPFFTTREEGVVVSAQNVFNPFGETLTDVRRRLVEAGPREFVQDNEAWHLVAGLDGLVGQWLWDVSISHGRNELSQRKTGDLLDSRLARALGPSFRDAQGAPVCGTPEAPIDGCVPLNLFGGPGSIDAAMLEYVGADVRDSGFNEQTVVGANAGGDLFELPAGPLAVALGYEYRDEDAADVPDPQTVAGNTTGSARGVTRGGFTTNALYVQLGLPVLRDRPAAEALDLELGARLVEHSSFGSEEVFKAGVFWRPVGGLGFRAAYSEAFRAPNVRELFGGQTQANPTVEDPCADFSELDPLQIERCVDQGVPADGSFAQTGEETPEVSGGNPELLPETARIVTAGVSWRPFAEADLTLDLDYYSIEIDDGIAGLGANTILEQCLATGAAAFCGRIDRDVGGAITEVSATLQNLASETAEGLDLALGYRHAGLGGQWQHRLLVSHVLERRLVAFPGAEPFAGAGEFDEDNFGAIPRWRGSVGTQFQRGPWRLGYDAQWIGALDERGGEVFPGTVNRIDDVLYHDLFAEYSWRGRAALTLGVDNLTDVQPPFFANADEANTDVSTYRLLGTTFWLRIGVSVP